MQITRQDLDLAVSQGFLTAEQVDPLWEHWQLRERNDESQPRLSSANVAYYFGTGIIALGMLWLLFLAWSDMWGGAAVFSIATVYACLFFRSGYYWWHERHQNFRLAGLMIMLAVGVVPIAVYGLQLAAGLWYRPPQYTDDTDEWSDDSFKSNINQLPMELSAVIAAYFAFNKFRFPMLTLTPLLVLSYMVSQWTDFLREGYGGEGLYGLILAGYGAICVILALFFEQSFPTTEGDNRDWTFWTYFVGAVALWYGSGLALNYRDSEVANFASFLINAAMICIAVKIKRNVFLVLGSLGVLFYAMHLNDLFGKYVLFPFLLTILGCGVISFGLQQSNVANNEQLARLLEASDQQEQGDGQPLSSIAGGSSTPSHGSISSSRNHEPGEQQEPTHETGV